MPLDRGRRLAPPENAPLMSPDRVQHSQAWTEYHQDVADALARLPGQVRKGVVDGSDAAAGDVGEYLTATGTGFAIGSGIASNVATLALTAGDWEVWGTVLFVPAGTTQPRQFMASIDGAGAVQLQATFTTGGQATLSTGPVRVSTAAALSVHLVGLTVFTTAGMTASGVINARRVR